MKQLYTTDWVSVVTVTFRCVTLWTALSSLCPLKLEWRLSKSSTLCWPVFNGSVIYWPVNGLFHSIHYNTITFFCAFAAYTIPLHASLGAMWAGLWTARLISIDSVSTAGQIGLLNIRFQADLLYCGQHGLLSADSHRTGFYQNTKLWLSQHSKKWQMQRQLYFTAQFKQTPFKMLYIGKELEQLKTKSTL